ncbi:hypothetical protein ACFLTP_09045 [Chloroflexota bacterium]
MKRTGIRVVLSLMLMLVMVIGVVAPVQAAPPDRWTVVEITGVYYDEGSYNFEAELTWNDVGAWGWAASWTTDDGDNYQHTQKFPEGRTKSGFDNVDYVVEVAPGTGVEVTVFLVKKNGNGIRKDYARNTDYAVYPTEP